MIFKAESGTVHVKRGKRIEWRMSADEADEFADFLFHVLTENDLGRRDAAALRQAARVAREEPS